MWWEDLILGIRSQRGTWVTWESRYVCWHLLSPIPYQGLQSSDFQKKTIIITLWEYTTMLFIGFFFKSVVGQILSLFGNTWIAINSFSESLTEKSGLLILLLCWTPFSAKWTNKNRIYVPFQYWIEAQLRHGPRNKTLFGAFLLWSFHQSLHSLLRINFPREVKNVRVVPVEVVFLLATGKQWSSYIVLLVRKAACKSELK